MVAAGAFHTPRTPAFASGLDPHVTQLHSGRYRRPEPQVAPVHHEGVTAWPGLYFLGLPWHRARGSSVLGWVGRDAHTLADRLITTAINPGKTLISP